MSSMIRIIKHGNEQASFQNKPQKFRNAITNSINIDKPDDTKSNCMKMGFQQEVEAIAVGQSASGNF